jgi:hypothetical protein
MLLVQSGINSIRVHILFFKFIKVKTRNCGTMLASCVNRADKTDRKGLDGNFRHLFGRKFLLQTIDMLQTYMELTAVLEFGH